MSFFNNLSTLFVHPETSKRKPKKSTAKKPLPKGAVVKKHKTEKGQRPQPQVSPQAVNAKLAQASSEAQARAREIIIEAKDQALMIRSDADNKARQQLKKLEEQQRSLETTLSKTELRLETVVNRESKLDETKEQLDELQIEVEATKKKTLDSLEKVSGMTKDQAKKFLMEGMEKKLSKDLAQLIRQKEEEAKQEADEKVKEILIESMRHGATDYVPEYTLSTVTLPSEEVKGKIIGKSGRNIHAFERITGVDVDLDTGPTEVRLSCFDPVRREIAKIALERLIKDGRIQPTRIEEVVGRVSQELDKVMFEAGRRLCHEVGIYNLPNELMQMLGRFKYRFSYGQNLIAHTLEETKIGIKLAHELKLDVNIVKLGCLLHDIGKVSPEEEGSHVELGVKIAKRFNLPQAVVDCIAQHHEDEPFTGPEQMAVYVADAISGARPGARYDNYDQYVERLTKLEEIATSYKEVEQAYAIQAGREIRVLLKPEASKDDDVEVLAMKIRDEIKEKVTYPGTVTVTVAREMRSQAVAK